MCCCQFLYQSVEWYVGYRTVDKLPEFLSQCDYVCNILPSTKDSKGLLSGEVFSHCKPKVQELYICYPSL